MKFKTFQNIYSLYDIKKSSKLKIHRFLISVQRNIEGSKSKISLWIAEVQEDHSVGENAFRQRRYYIITILIRNIDNSFPQFVVSYNNKNNKCELQSPSNATMEDF